jgi:hypothetical protein
VYLKPCRPGHVQRARGKVGSPCAGSPPSVPPQAHDGLRSGAGLGLAAGTSAGLRAGQGQIRRHAPDGGGTTTGSRRTTPGEGLPPPVPTQTRGSLRASIECAGTCIVGGNLPKYIYSLETLLREALQQADGGVGSPGAGLLQFVPVRTCDNPRARSGGAGACIARRKSWPSASTSPTRTLTADI